MENNQVYFELVGERNRTTSEIHELMYLLDCKMKEADHLDRLIAEQRLIRMELVKS